MEITPKSLILDLLSTLPSRGGHSMPVRALIEAAGRFGMASSSVRVALARLLAQERVERDERGRYRLGVAADAVSGAIRSWRRLEDQVVPWSQGWAAVHRARIGSRRARRSGDQSLVFLGFREFEPGLFVRPDNLKGSIAELRRRLMGLGLEDSARVFGLTDFDEISEARARGLWDRDALSSAYQEACDALAESHSRLSGAPVADAMMETFRLGGRVIRQLVLDPLLPEELAPAEPRRRLVAQMREYDAFGRGCWAGFLGTHGVSHRSAPVDLRVAEGTEQLASAALLRRRDLASTQHREDSGR